MIDEELLKILACPKCKGDITLLPKQGLLCPKCRLIYPIREGIPIMLVEEAIPYSEGESFTQEKKDG